MPSEILINAGAGETRAARVEDGVLQGYAVESAFAEGPRAGDIYIGRVTRVMAAMQAAFVDIGAARDGFLALRDAAGPVHEGQAIPVQVTRETVGEKGAKLTGRITLNGELAARARMARPPALLQAGPGLVERLLRDWRADAVLADDARLAARHGVTLAREDLFLRHDLEDQVAALYRPRVALPCGGWITLEKTEGLTAIDVNSGSFAASGGREETARQVNLEAAREAGRQIVLRGIGGLIVLDFIQMERGREAVTEALAHALTHTLARHPATADVAPMNAHGVVSIARQRRDAPLAAPRPEQAILRAVERAARAAPGREITVRAAPAWVKWLSQPDVRAGLDRRGVGRVRFLAEDREDFDVES
ncbi:MAG TPA: ribonuclease E/G [Rhizomicrobium sp.]|nr:ribonuclease E/G [Rhizomicrobium sp.]